MTTTNDGCIDRDRWLRGENGLSDTGISGFPKPSYRPLPIFKPSDRPLTIPEYQAEVLRFLLATGCTATLSETDLGHAEAAACRACAQSQDLDVIAILSAARHTIAEILKFRKELADMQDGAPIVASSGARPSGGLGAKLEPAPTVNPPAPAYASVGSGPGFGKVDIAF